MEETLTARLENLGHRLDPSAVSRLDHFVSLVQKYGAKFNLVGNLDRAFIENDLVCSSFELLQLAMPSGTMVDVGSGAGFPGVPLAVAAPDAQVLLVERRRKRAGFLEHVVRQLGLKNVRVRHEDINGLAGETFDWVVARAFAPPQGWLKLASRLTRNDGHVCVYSNNRVWKTVDLTEWRIVGKCIDRSGSDRIVVCLHRARESE